jgi:hypothetical protein
VYLEDLVLEDLLVVHCDAFLVLFGRSKKIYLVSSSQICRTNQLSIDTSLGNVTLLQTYWRRCGLFVFYFFILLSTCMYESLADVAATKQFHLEIVLSWLERSNSFTVTANLALQHASYSSTCKLSRSVGQ